MADERLVPMTKDGQPVELAVTPKDFFSAKLSRKGDARDAGEMVTYAQAGYTLSDRFESLEPYDGPRTQRQYEHAQEARRATREAPKAEMAKADAPAPAEVRKPA